MKIEYLPLLVIAATIIIGLFLVFTPLAKADMDEPTPERVFLVVLNSTNTSSTGFTYTYHIIDSMAKCYEIIEKSRVAIPNGGDAEAAVAMYCAPSKAKIWLPKEMSK